MSSKKVIFGVLAAALPIVLLIVVEAGLRLAGVHEAERQAFIPIPGKASHMMLNPEYVDRYFTDFRPGIAFTPFAAEQAPRTFRVFVLGGSSAAGFPYAFYDGFPTLLGEQLQSQYPEQHIEVINVAMTAVNSYTLWDLAPRIAAQAPDAVVIYAGHNEYYGALGVGSQLSGVQRWPWLKRLSLRMQDVVLYRMLQGLIMGEAPPRPPGGGTLMSRAVQDATIALEGDVYHAGLGQFERNMADVLTTFSQAGIPVLMGTVASNLADQPPLGNVEIALTAFERGQALADADTAAAYAAFLDAKEHDDIRFRAPEAVNTTLRTLAQQRAVTLVDTEAVLRAASPGGLPGDDLFTDHLHPTATGYALMADAFAEAMRPLFGSEPLRPPAPQALLSPFDDTLADLNLRLLKSAYPFVKERTPDEEQRVRTQLLQAASQGAPLERLASESVQRGLTGPPVLQRAFDIGRSAGDTLGTLLTYRALLHWQPFNEDLHRTATAFALSTTDAYPEAAHRVALRGAQSFPEYPYYWNALAALALFPNEPVGARRALGYLTRVEGLAPTNTTMLTNTARAYVILGDLEQARVYFTRSRQP
ncbi:MAG: GDSL-type esterase/lipase family protein [Bacteroidota bacterium]